MGRNILRRRKIKQESAEGEDFSTAIGLDLEKNMQDLQEMIGNPGDLVIRRLTLGFNVKAAVVFISGLSDKEAIHNDLIKNLLRNREKELGSDTPEDLIKQLKLDLISIGSVEQTNSLDKLIIDLLSGKSVVYVDGTAEALLMGTEKWETRSIDEPISESLIRGPREGFVENLQTNMMLIRRHIRDPNLRFDTSEVGRRSKKKLVVCYVDGIVNPDMVKEVNRRLASIDMDSAMESGYIEQWIEDSYLSPFPQMDNTERPDKVASAILQGKVGILLDGSPFALIAPITIANAFKSPEDYYDRWLIATFLRVIRYIGAFITMFLPALYIALVSYHQGMIPSQLAFSIAATREGVPFPAFVEAIIMGLTMELLREAGARLPRTIGQTIGIVGGLVIGEAAVSAGIVSPIMVIVVALTAVASFTIPLYSVAISFRLLRFGFMLAAAVLGLYGIVLVYIMINIHIVNLKSMGVPYSTPFAPSFIKDWKDLVLRGPIPMMNERPRNLKPKDTTSGNLRR
ncbi:spore germination protein B1 [Oceanobacillus picturae]|uniref:Spore germination protein B1 n=1 Tax=Oceanobacillus picturae TaxID=171693 RepID=A0A0U9H9W1_9BACI|nr:spore germination protein [Oceanobacillus picturae]GAQ19514.1 spore germination protein B1 [Oceanobacillus picturae]